MLHSSLFNETVQLAIDDRLLVLNSAADPFLPVAAQRIPAGEIVLAEDNISALRNTQKVLRSDRFKTFRARHVPFHDYTVYEPPATCNVALMNTLYQPANAWMQYGLQLAAYALQPGGRLYVQGAKDRGIVSLAKHMQTLLGNVETLEISKGERLVCSFVSPGIGKDARSVDARGVDAINRVPTHKKYYQRVPISRGRSDSRASVTSSPPQLSHRRGVEPVWTIPQHSQIQR